MPPVSDGGIRRLRLACLCGRDYDAMALSVDFPYTFVRLSAGLVSPFALLNQASFLVFAACSAVCRREVTFAPPTTDSFDKGSQEIIPLMSLI